MNLTIHRDEFKCKACGQVFEEKKDMDQHITQVHCGDTRFKCPFCRRVYLTDNLWVSHYRMTHLDILNDPSSFKRGTKEWKEEKIAIGLQAHSEIAAKKKLAEAAALLEASKNELIICDVCNEPFTGEMKYHIHFDNPLPDDSDQPPQSSTASVAQAPAIGSVLVNNFICQICDIEFLSEDAIRAHCHGHLKEIFESARGHKLINSSTSVTGSKAVQGSSSSTTE